MHFHKTDLFVLLEVSLAFLKKTLMGSEIRLTTDVLDSQEFSSVYQELALSQQLSITYNQQQDESIFQF